MEYCIIADHRLSLSLSCRPELDTPKQEKSPDVCEAQKMDDVESSAASSLAASPALSSTPHSSSFPGSRTTSPVNIATRQAQEAILVSSCSSADLVSSPVPTGVEMSSHPTSSSPERVESVDSSQCDAMATQFDLEMTSLSNEHSQQRTVLDGLHTAERSPLSAAQVSRLSSVAHQDSFRPFHSLPLQSLYHTISSPSTSDNHHP